MQTQNKRAPAKTVKKAYGDKSGKASNFITTDQNRLAFKKLRRKMGR
jgi:hypothetical protein